MNTKDLSKEENAKQCWEEDHNLNWDQNKIFDRESRLVFRKIKETINSSMNPNHINEISYILCGIWLFNLQEFLVTYLFYTHRF